MVCGEVPAALDPVGRRDLDADRLVGRKNLADRVEHFQRIAHAVLQGPAILVGALVGDRRQELMQQIAVRARAVRGHRGQAGSARFAAATKASRTRGNPGVIERERRRLAFLVRHRGRPFGLPAAFSRAGSAVRPPTAPARSLAAGMRELHRDGDLRMLAHRGDDRLQRRFGSVVPQAKAARRDAADGLDMRGLDAEHRGARQRERIDMGEVPIIGLAVFGRILAHRRHHDAVRKF